MPQAERDRIGEIIFRFCFGQLYRHGLFNGDPHPGNYLLLDDGSVAFVDYGCVAEFSDETIAASRTSSGRSCDGDKEAWRRHEERRHPRPGAPFTTEELYEHMHWYWAPILEDEVTFTPELAAEMVRRNTQTGGHGRPHQPRCNVPEGMVFLTRINFGLAGLLAGLTPAGRGRRSSANTSMARRRRPSLAGFRAQVRAKRGFSGERRLVRRAPARQRHRRKVWRRRDRPPYCRFVLAIVRRPRREVLAPRKPQRFAPPARHSGHQQRSFEMHWLETLQFL